MTTLPYALRIILVLFLVLAAAEMSAKTVNWLLLVILLGLGLAQYQPTSRFIKQLGATLQRR